MLDCLLLLCYVLSNAIAMLVMTVVFDASSSTSDKTMLQC